LWSFRKDEKREIIGFPFLIHLCPCTWWFNSNIFRIERMNYTKLNPCMRMTTPYQRERFCYEVVFYVIVTLTLLLYGNGGCMLWLFTLCISWRDPHQLFFLSFSNFIRSKQPLLWDETKVSEPWYNIVRTTDSKGLPNLFGCRPRLIFCEEKQSSKLFNMIDVLMSVDTTITFCGNGALHSFCLFLLALVEIATLNLELKMVSWMVNYFHAYILLCIRKDD
jgi:hypothetical protein